MLPFLSSPRSHRFWAHPIVLCGVFVLVSVPPPSEAGDFTPEERKKIIENGINSADQEHEMKDLDRQLRQGNLTQAQKESLETQKADLQRRIDGKKGEVETVYGLDGVKLYDEARGARAKQWEIKELKDKLATAPDKEKPRIQRRIDRLTLELGDYPEDILKALEGTPLAYASEDTGQSYAFTGLVLQIGWTPPPSTAPAKNGGNLPTLVAGVSLSPDFTPEKFSQSLQTSGPNKTGNWVLGDNQSPPVQKVNGGKIDFKVKLGYAFGKPNSMYNLAIGAGFNSTSLPFLQGDLSSVNDNDVGTMVINTNPSFILSYPEGTNPWSLGPPLMGRPLDWSVEHYLRGGIFSNFQENHADRATFLNKAGASITGSEPNAGVTGAPAPGLTPSTWPDTEAWPIPRLEMEASR